MPHRQSYRSRSCFSVILATELVFVAVPIATAAPTQATTPDEPTPPAQDAPPTGASPGGEDAAEPTLREQAIAAFEVRDYDRSIRLFEQAYAADPQPNYLFNIGRVHEEKGELRQAVEFYRRFLGQPGVALESRQLALERLKVLRESAEQVERKKNANRVCAHPRRSPRVRVRAR